MKTIHKMRIIIAFFVFMLCCSWGTVGAQLSILDDYEACRDFAVNGTGVDPTVVIPGLLSACTGVLWQNGVYHVGDLVHTQQEMDSRVAALQRFTGLAVFTPAINAIDTPITYCGRNTSLNFTGKISGQVAFFEVSMVNDPLTHVNFYTDWYKRYGPSAVYIGLDAKATCAAVQSCLTVMNIPVFFQLPVVPQLNASTLFIRDAFRVYEIVCGGN